MANISYKPTTAGNKLRTIHIMVIGEESITSTKAKDLLIFAKPRTSKWEYKYIKEAVRLGESLTITDGAIG